MFVALAALLLQISPAQALTGTVVSTNNSTEKPSVSAPATEISSRSTAPLPLILDTPLVLANLGLRPGSSVFLSTPDASAASAFPDHPQPADAGSSNGSGFTPATPNPVRGTPGGAGMISVIELQAEVRHHKRIWYSLAAVEHGTAVFDAWTTRRSIANGGEELNPMFKPFAHSGAIYAATQAGPLLFDYLGKRMMMSRSPVLRRMWWLPQMASTAASFISGVHNLGVHSPSSGELVSTKPPSLQ